MKEEDKTGGLKPIGGSDKEKRITKLLTLVSEINVRFNIYDWNNLLNWNELRVGVIPCIFLILFFRIKLQKN